jgi:outer membrane protein assembly factor BamB
MQTFFLAAMLCAEPAAADIWPAFRGDGSSRSVARDLPLKWSPKENLAWRVTLPGYGQSSPIVWQDRVFLTAVEGPDKEKCIVLAADVQTGKALWRKEFKASQKGKNNPSVSRAASTPVVDGSGVYVFFESGDLIALTHAGEVKWARSLTKEYGEFQNQHGLGSSPAQTEKAVVVLVEHDGPSYLLAVDKATGKNLWKTDRAKGLSWASPVVTSHEGRTMVLVSSNGSLIAYNADNGQELWRVGDLTGNLIPSATVGDGFVVIGAGEGGLTFDRQAAAKSNCCVRLTAKEGKPAGELAWQGQKVVLHHASPVIHRGYVYLVTKAGMVHCLDLKAGERKYAERLADPCWATPIAAGDHVYFFGKAGITTVIKAGPVFSQVAGNRLWNDDDITVRKKALKDRPEDQFPPLPEQGKKEMEAMLADAVGEVVYGVAAVDGTFLIRTGTELFCIRKSK